jgi:hypothetical protein
MLKIKLPDLEDTEIIIEAIVRPVRPTIPLEGSA